MLQAVDEDIVSLEVPRSAAEARQSMAFKDSMRETALADVAQAWVALVAAHRADHPALAAQARAKLGEPAQAPLPPPHVPPTRSPR